MGSSFNFKGGSSGASATGSIAVDALTIGNYLYFTGSASAPAGGQVLTYIAASGAFYPVDSSGSAAVSSSVTSLAEYNVFSEVPGKIFYVGGANASDSNPGTDVKPLYTVNAAIEKVAEQQNSTSSQWSDIVVRSYRDYSAENISIGDSRIRRIRIFADPTPAGTAQVQVDFNTFYCTQSNDLLAGVVVQGFKFLGGFYISCSVDNNELSYDDDFLVSNCEINVETRVTGANWVTFLSSVCDNPNFYNVGVITVRSDSSIGNADYLFYSVDEFAAKPKYLTDLSYSFLTNYGYIGAAFQASSSVGKSISIINRGLWVHSELKQSGFTGSVSFTNSGLATLSANATASFFSTGSKLYHNGGNISGYDRIHFLDGASEVHYIGQPLNNYGITSSGSLTIGSNRYFTGSASTPEDGNMLVYTATSGAFVPLTPIETKKVSGFLDRTSSTISFDSGSREFTISGSSYTVYRQGIKHVFTGSRTITLDDREGLAFIYFSGSNMSLSASLVFDNALFLSEPITSIIRWDSTNKKHTYFAEERHGLVMDGATHLYLHNTRGAKHESGFSLGHIQADENGSSNAHAQFFVSDGTFWDEDIEFNIVDSSPQKLSGSNGVATIPVLYLSGSDSWRISSASNFPLIYSGTVGTDYTGALMAYNLYSGGVWSLSTVNNLYFCLVHYFATNNMAYPVIGVCGQTQYANSTLARAGATSEIKTLFSLGLPFEEMSPVATVIFQSSTGYSNTVKTRIRTTSDGYDYIDLRDANITSAGAIAVTSHGALTGLANDDHTQYVLSNGTRAITGSQIVSGSLTVTGSLRVTGSDFFDIGENIISNLEESSKSVRYGSRFFMQPTLNVSESAAVYIRLNPSGTGEQSSGIYCEITSEQQDTEAAAIKIVSYGAGDSVYAASFNSGPGYEAASFYNGSRGVISTLQYTGSVDGTGSVSDFGNSTLFQAVWGWDGTGGSITQPNYGVFYSARSLGNSFVVRKQNRNSEGMGEGRTEFRISEFDLDRNRVEFYNDGNAKFLSMTASADTTEQDSPTLDLIGAYWSGAASSDKNVSLRNVVDVAGTNDFRIYIGSRGGEALEAVLTNTELNLQNNNLVGVGSYNGYSTLYVIGASATSASHQDSPEIILRGNYWNGTSSLSYDTTFKTVITSTGSGELRFYVGGGLSTIWRATNIDFQAHDLTTCGNLYFYSDGGYNIGQLNTNRPAEVYVQNEVHCAGDTFHLATSRTITASNADGIAGEICWDSDHIYVCVAANTWKKTQISGSW
jgi:hypothetical protein